MKNTLTIILLLASLVTLKAQDTVAVVNKKERDYQKWRIGAQGGWSYLTGNLSYHQGLASEKYISELKSGAHIGGDITYFILPYLGFGVKYSWFRSRNKREINFFSTLDPIVLRDDIRIQHIGPSVCTRLSSANKKVHFITNLSMGYYNFKNTASNFEDFEVTGRTYSLMYDVGLDVSLDKNLTLGLFFGYYLASLKTFNYNSNSFNFREIYDRNSAQNISRLDLSIGLNWNL
jgi:hypothetical protein